MLSIHASIATTESLRQLELRLMGLFVELKTYDADMLEAMHRYARISTVGASTRIENAMLTDSEVEWLDTVLTQDGKTTAFENQHHKITNKLSKDRERSIAEVAGCRAMLDLIYEQSSDFVPLMGATLKGLHTVLLQYYPQASHYLGTYKKQPNSVVEHNHQTGATQMIFETADPGPMTAAAMSDLLVWYNEALHQVPSSIAVACEFVYRFLAIHPFQDGNGRLGRGLFILALLQSKDESIRTVASYLAIDRQIERNKKQYYTVLNQCSGGRYAQDPKQYHMEYFLNYMIKILNNAVSDVAVYKNKWLDHKKLSESARQVLTCFKENPEIRLSTKLLHQQTELPKRTISYVLKQLVDKRFIQRYGQGAGVRYQLVF